MRHGEAVFVDSGAWIALALLRDSFHAQANERWQRLAHHGAKLRTSIPVVIETFTFLQRADSPEVALAWKDALYQEGGIEILPCGPRDLEHGWGYFRRRDLHKLSAVDATSFAIMRRARIRLAFAFDHHFAMAGFRLVE